MSGSRIEFAGKKRILSGNIEIFNKELKISREDKDL